MPAPFEGLPAAATLAQSILLAQLILLRRIDKRCWAPVVEVGVAKVSLFLPSLMLLAY